MDKAWRRRKLARDSRWNALGVGTVAARVVRWCRTHPKLVFALTLIGLVAALNVVAYLHARALTHFARGGHRTERPEALSLWGKLKVALTGVTIPRPSNAATPQDFGLGHEVHHFTSADGVGLEAWHVSSLRANGLVLMFHGYSAAKASLLPEAQAFHELGWDTLLVDFRGSGGSDGDETTIGVREAADVSGAWEYARMKWPDRQLVLFGHSMGSVAVLRAVALAGVRPAGLILECPFDRMLATVGNRFAAMGLPAFPLAHLLVFWGGVQNGFNGFGHNPVDYAAAVDCPVLLMQGAADVRVTPAEAEGIFAALGGDKQLNILQRVGHDSYAECAPEPWKTAVEGLLSQVLRSRRCPPPKIIGATVSPHAAARVSAFQFTSPNRCSPSPVGEKHRLLMELRAGSR
jgi:alpha-beta hydrolase superfamily lysophospholipase